MLPVQTLKRPVTVRKTAGTGLLQTATRFHWDPCEFAGIVRFVAIGGTYCFTKVYTENTRQKRAGHKNIRRTTLSHTERQLVQHQMLICSCVCSLTVNTSKTSTPIKYTGHEIKMKEQTKQGTKALYQSFCYSETVLETSNHHSKILQNTPTHKPS